MTFAKTGETTLVFLPGKNSVRAREDKGAV